MTDGWEDAEIADLEDEYELLGEVGRGASAVVYRARDRALGRLVAIKVVRPHAVASADDAMRRLAREARTVARLQHPNIVTVHAVKRLRTGGLALVMQLVPGRTLKQAITEHGPFAPEQAERVLHDVAEALAYAHAHGVVHRDVKPENIFLDADTGRAMLSDFGIAHSTDFESRLTMTGAAIGTPAYMAPEQIDGAPADARSDVYSLGLVAWEMLTGRRPWDGESLYNVITKQKQEELPAIDALRPGAVPPRLQYIVERMLQKRPAARWAGADGVLAKLDHWVVPNDWQQWEAAHKRRREAARAVRAEERAKRTPPSSASMATIRFRRPVDESRTATPAMAVQLIEHGAAATETSPGLPMVDDSTPSWALETVPPPPRRGRRFALLGVAALTVMGSGALLYAELSGRLDVRALVGLGGRPPAVALNPPRPSDPLPLPPADSLADSAAAAPGLPAEGGTPTPGLLDGRVTDREPSTAVQVVPNDSLPPRPRRRIVPPVDSAPVESLPAAPAIRATDDAGVVAAGGRHSCVLSVGRALCWGANDRGQLGDGDVESRDLPGLVVGEIEFAQIAAGLAHTCGVTSGGDAYCWGADDRGQLGDATTTSRSAPVRVAGTLSFRLVRTGANHSCGLTPGGDIACWGANTNGQLGDGTTGMRSSPVRVGRDRRYVSLTTGWNHTCAIATDGAAWCWGANADGQVGDGSRTDHRTPQPVAASVRFTSLSAGGNHTCGVSDEGEVLCWGRNAFGQLGIGGTASQAVPAKVASTTRFTSVSAGGVHSCARTSGGQAWCWGRNIYGQLGDGTMIDRDTPTRVVGGASFTAVSATGAHTCGATGGGEVSCWGFNVQGQLGDGTRNHLARPTRVAIPGR